MKAVTTIQFPSSRKQMCAASAVVNAAIRNGKLVRPRNCSECGKTKRKILAHHDQYENPLAVLWLCASCHTKRHAAMGTSGIGDHIRLTPDTTQAIKAIQSQFPVKVSLNALVNALVKDAIPRFSRGVILRPVMGKKGK